MNWPTTDDDIIRQVVIMHEGGFVNNPHDAGGATNYGITQITLSEWRGHPVTVEDVRNMPMSEAIAIYSKKYLTDPGFNKIADMKVRTAIVDAGVLFGQKTVVKALQAIIGVMPDAVLGPGTIAAMAHLEPRWLVNALSVWRIMRHATRCESDHTQAVFIKGWDQRACDFIV